jgi:glycosyltransferase involved in cell wall biosynthesis
MGLSVVVCTYNGVKLMPETIRHLALQRVRPEIEWEIIIVDNASTDDTSKVVMAEWQKYENPVPFSLLYQPHPGLTFARELALEKSEFEFVLFCDDDNWLNPDYINMAYDLMLQHPSIGVLGGKGELVFETPPPGWATELKLYANGPQALVSGEVKYKVVYGAGCIIRKSAYETIMKAGYKSMLTDRSPNKLSAGGDYEFCFAIALAGYTIWYHENLSFKHFMSKERINWNYLIRLIREGVQSFDVLIPYRIRVGLNSKSLLYFNLNMTRIILSYLAKLLLVLFEILKSNPESDEAKICQLKFIALKAKLLTFRNYSIMKENFLSILDFEQNNLKPYLSKEQNLISGNT